MTACPSCFEQVPVDHYTWICKSGKCVANPDPVASAYLGATVNSGPITEVKRPADATRKWGPPTVAHCSQCGQAASEVCPICHYSLLPDWRLADVTTIAMNGARATGKSFYIAVAIHQLRQLLVHLRTTVEFANDHTRDTYKKVYEAPLFEQLGLIAPTPRSDTDNSYQREPMIFSIGMLKGRNRFIAMRDVAGEEMEKASAEAANLSFLRHADSVFFMFDPLAIPEIRDRLSDLLPQQLHQGGDPRVVLGNFLRLLKGATPRVAIVVSKFDAMQALREVNDPEWKTIMSNPGAAFMRDSSLDSGSYDHADGELLSLEIESLLHNLGASNFVLSLEQGAGGKSIPHRFFAISALGASTEGESLSKYGISPFRILDPLKWILDARGVI